MYKWRQPPCESLGFRSRLTPWWQLGGLKAVWDTRGGSLASETSGCHSARSYVSSTGWEMEQHLLQEPGKVEVGAAKGIKMPRGEDISS